MNNDTIDEIRKKVDIVDVISSYIPLVQKGRNFVGVCPFHDDTKPSLSVSRSLQIFKCFACGHAGNIFNFICDYEHIEFKDALRKVADMAGVKLDVSGIKNTNNKDEKLFQLNEFALNYYKNNLNSKEGSKAREYLSKRQLDDDNIKEFEIGLSLSNKTSLTDILEKKGFSLEELNRMDLSNNNYDTFIDRIIFPLHNFSGRVIGFSGRIYDNSELSKYQNTKQTPLFKKGEVIFNYHRVRESVRKEKSVIVMEGFMAVIRSSINGIKNCVALMGTAMTNEQMNAIKRLSNNIILCFDGDKAGIKATLVNGEQFVKIGINPKVIALNDSLDPDDYILKYGIDSFKNLIDNAITFNEFKIRDLKNNSDLRTEDGKTEYINNVLKNLILEKDDIKSEMVLKQLAKEFDIWYNTLANKLNTLRKENVETKSVSVQLMKPAKSDKYEQAELTILLLMLINNETIEIVRKRNTILPHKEARFFMAELISYYDIHGSVDLAVFYTYCHDKEDLLILLNKISSVLLINSETNTINDYLNVIDEFNKSQEIKRLKEIMKNENDPIKQALIAEEIRNIKMKEECEKC